MAPQELQDLAAYKRIAIAGGPRTGKTTLADALSAIRGGNVVHTDALIGACSWEQTPHEIIDLCRPLDLVVVEGVQVARALRKGLVVDVVVWLLFPHETLTPKQQSMTKGIMKVFREWRDAHPDVKVVEL